MMAKENGKFGWEKMAKFEVKWDLADGAEFEEGFDTKADAYAHVDKLKQNADVVLYAVCGSNGEPLDEPDAWYQKDVTHD